MTRDEYNKLSRIVLYVRITFYKEMRPDLLESIYEQRLMSSERSLWEKYLN